MLHLGLGGKERGPHKERDWGPHSEWELRGSTTTQR